MLWNYIYLEFKWNINYIKANIFLYYNTVHVIYVLYFLPSRKIIRLGNCQIYYILYLLKIIIVIPISLAVIFLIFYTVSCSANIFHNYFILLFLFLSGSIHTCRSKYTAFSNILLFLISTTSILITLYFRLKEDWILENWKWKNCFGPHTQVWETTCPSASSGLFECLSPYINFAKQELKVEHMKNCDCNIHFTCNLFGGLLKMVKLRKVKRHTTKIYLGICNSVGK